MSHRGFSLIEMLIALAIIGILLAVGVSRFGSNSARAYTNDVKAIVQQARFEAVKRNVPVSVVWNSGSDEFRTVLGTASSPCTAGTILAIASHQQYRGVVVDSSFADGDGVVWLPSGQARSCGLGPFSPTIAEISDSSRSFTLTVTLTGRVTVE